MGKWLPTSRPRAAGGRFRIIATPLGGTPRDITSIRGVPVTLTSFSDADPFGYASARLDFPMLSGYDAPGSGELDWLTRHSLIDIYHSSVLWPIGSPKAGQPMPIWQGLPMNNAFDQSDSGDGWGRDHVGALYQADRYKAHPQFPIRPQTYESLLAQGFDPTYRPHMKTAPLASPEWPAGWTKVFTQAMADEPTVFRPDGLVVGSNYTGYSTRQTGAWDPWLTSFAQNLLAVMWVDEEAGVTPGNQWTLMCDPGRIPVLRIRDRFGDPDIVFWYGTPGTKLSGMSQDFSQTSDIMYGEGQGLDGTSWRNATVSADGSHTDYAPMVVDDSVWPPNSSNSQLDTTRIIAERMVQFTPGISQLEAYAAAGQMAELDRDPGWTGTITFSSDQIDPDGNLVPRWGIKAGMRVLVKGFAGSGEGGTLFHISQTTKSPADGTVTATVDTKFRDALTLEEVIARTRDPLTPSKLLQVNRRSITIEDQMAPWDYTAGSGLMPRNTLRKSFFADLPTSSRFPWKDQALRYPPGANQHMYVRVKASSPHRKDRWTFFPILMSEKGTIADLQIAAYDYWGRVAKVKFHLSLYYVNVTWEDMPFDDNGPSPFITDAFQTTTENGDPYPANTPWAPDQSMIIGWGTKPQPAGYSPGSYSDGDHVTGMLEDASPFTFDCTHNPNFDLYAKKGVKEPKSAYTIYGALYCEELVPGEDTGFGQSHLYFTGRMFRQTPGT